MWGRGRGYSRCRRSKLRLHEHVSYLATYHFCGDLCQPSINTFVLFEESTARMALSSQHRRDDASASANILPASTASSPLRGMAPFALSYSGKRGTSPRRSVVDCPSPPKARRDTRATPSRATPRAPSQRYDASHHRRHSPPDVATGVNDITTPTVSRLSTHTLSGCCVPIEQALKVSSIIQAIHAKPLSQRRAILKHRRRVIASSESASLSSGARGKKQSKVTAHKTKKKTKSPRPAKAKSGSTKKPRSFLSGNLITAIRTHVFPDDTCDVPLYSDHQIEAHNKAFQTQLLFRFSAKRKKNIITTSLGRRSQVADDLLSNDDAYNVNTTNFKELSRYVVEDVIACQVDTPFVLCIAKDMDVHYQRILSDGASQQRKLNMGGDICKISGREYYCLHVTLQVANFHTGIVHGTTTLDQFVKLYDQREGFVLSIDRSTVRSDVNKTLTITCAWDDLVHLAGDIMLYGRPFSTSRGYDQLLRMKNSNNYVFHVFKHLALEYRGDSVQSSLLYASYLKRVNEMQAEALVKAPLVAEKDILRRLSTTTVTQRIFIQLFDGLCQNEFIQCLQFWNDYAVEIIREDDLDRFVDAAQHKAFPDQWKVLAGMRGLNENLGNDHETGRLITKRRQIFFQLLSLIRMSNPALLSHWALIQSVANFGWGVPATANDVACYWGNCVSTSSRSRKLAELSSNLTFHYRRLMSLSLARLFCFDNYQVGMHKEDQQGGHSKDFFLGTNEVAHKVHEYNETKWDDTWTDITGHDDQPLPSPPGMAKYELAPTDDKLGTFLLEHGMMDGDPEPDFSGERVQAYERLLRLTATVEHVQNVFAKSSDMDNEGILPKQGDRDAL